jgi:hypothetical protein
MLNSFQIMVEDKLKVTLNKQIVNLCIEKVSYASLFSEKWAGKLF